MDQREESMSCATIHPTAHLDITLTIQPMSIPKGQKSYRVHRREDGVIVERPRFSPHPDPKLFIKQTATFKLPEVKPAWKTILEKRKKPVKKVMKQQKPQHVDITHEVEVKKRDARMRNIEEDVRGVRTFDEELKKFAGRDGYNQILELDQTIEDDGSTLRVEGLLERLGF